MTSSKVCANFLDNLWIFNSEWEIYAIFEFIVFIVTVSWLRHLQNISANDMYMQHGNKVIFPIHKALLIFLILISLFESLVVMIFLRYFFDKSTFTVEYIFSLMYGCAAGFNAFADEGSALLFISSGIGQRSIKKSFYLASAWCLCTICVYFIYFLAIFSSNPKYQTNSFLHFQEVLTGIWQAMLFSFYLSIYITSYFKLKRFRPAAILWSKFWIVTRFLLFLSPILVRFDIDVGHCLFAITFLLFFIVLKYWVAYRCYRLEARWWHGEIDSNEENSDTYLFGSLYHKFIKFINILLNYLKFQVETTSLTPTKDNKSKESIFKSKSNSFELASQEQINNSLENASPLVGVQLSGIPLNVHIFSFFS